MIVRLAARYRWRIGCICSTNGLPPCETRCMADSIQLCDAKDRGGSATRCIGSEMGTNGDRFELMRLFVRIAEARSLSAAGRLLGLSQPSTSRQLKQLET